MPNDYTNESQCASLTPSDWSFFARQGTLENPIFCVLGFFFMSVHLSCPASKRLLFYFIISAVFLPLSKSIIYSRYNTWIGQILSAWAPLLWQGLERGWKLLSRRNEFCGFEYVIGFIISGGRATLYRGGKKISDIKNLSLWGFKQENTLQTEP